MRAWLLRTAAASPCGTPYRARSLGRTLQATRLSEPPQRSVRSRAAPPARNASKPWRVRRPTKSFRADASRSSCPAPRHYASFSSRATPAAPPTPSHPPPPCLATPCGPRRARNGLGAQPSLPGMVTRRPHPPPRTPHHAPPTRPTTTHPPARCRVAHRRSSRSPAGGVCQAPSCQDTLLCHLLSRCTVISVEKRTQHHSEVCHRPTESNQPGP